MKIYVNQIVKGLKRCDILRHEFYNCLTIRMLKGAFCDIVCRKVATNRVAKWSVYVTDIHTDTKHLSQDVATKKGVKYMNSS